MPRRRNSELIRAQHFVWRLQKRHGVYHADGRSNSPSAGRHSLGTCDLTEAHELLVDLDIACAVRLGLIAPPPQPAAGAKPLSLDEGRHLYENHIRRPRALGGVAKSTDKRYRTVFDKFIAFARTKGINNWNAVDEATLTEYAAYLEAKGYLSKTLVNELTVLKQAMKWFIEAGHLIGRQPLKLKLKKAESQRAYCWRPEEVDAMLAWCASKAELAWLSGVATALARTGLRIAELAGLRWSDINGEAQTIELTDESGHAAKGSNGRRHLKSGRSRRLPIHPDLAAVLVKLPHCDRYVFHGPRGGRLKPDTVRRAFVAEVVEPLADRFPSRLEEQGFKDGRMHSFRHYFCSVCATSGVPEQIVMSWLGHADSEMVRHYFHLHDSASQAAMNKIRFTRPEAAGYPGQQVGHDVGDGGDRCDGTTTDRP